MSYHVFEIYHPFPVIFEMDKYVLQRKTGQVSKMCDVMWLDVWASDGISKFWSYYKIWLISGGAICFAGTVLFGIEWHARRLG